MVITLIQSSVTLTFSLNTVLLAPVLSLFLRFYALFILKNNGWNFVFALRWLCLLFPYVSEVES